MKTLWENDKIFGGINHTMSLSGPTSHRKEIPEQHKNELISKLLKNSSFLLFKN
jgi:hypothetical protein